MKQGDNGRVQTICCDTSFLYSFYGTDAHSPAAQAEVVGLADPLLITSLNTFELANALRFAECRKLLSAGRANALLSDLQQSIRAGKIVLARWCDLPAVVAEAERLSSRHTLTGGFRAFDILHVAAALHLRADVFLSFDNAQRQLALAEGLAVRP